MVQQAFHGTGLSGRIDRTLDYLFAQWKDVPLVACEWDTWDGIDKEVYLLEWTMPRERLNELASQVEAGALSDGQMARYRELRGLIAQHTPTLERLFAGE